MFTGITTAIGTIRALETRGDLHAVIACPYDPAAIAIGASIACSGVCLTVVERGGTAGDAWFSVDISGETQARTVPGRWAVGAALNLEPALRLGDELGGHIVTGHVDGVAMIEAMVAEGDSLRVTLRAPEALARFIAPKGSVALNGTSLTVNEVSGAEFGVNLIPHTQEVTTWGEVAVGDKVNLEVDTMARYVARLREYD